MAAAGSLERDTRGMNDAVVVIIIAVCFVVAVGGFVTGIRLVRRVRAEAEEANAERDGRG